MSWVKTMTIWCNVYDCAATIIHRREDELGTEVVDLEEAGWRQRADGQDYCPEHAR
jgi:hypothetical protein